MGGSGHGNGGGGSGGNAASSGGSHGEGTTTPDGRPAANHPDDRTGSDADLREDVPLEDIYGGRADVAGYEDDVEGATEDAAG
ncbi:MAG: hypothetical protein JWM86_1042 [Thermoleophilia bacterium]|nr:hypothetical protein [Thermoleophilia bacterium]